MMATRGGSLSHTYEVNGTLEGFFWVCSCGEGSDPVHASEYAAIAAAEQHVAESPERR